jgi:uncharacterized membrane protein
VELLDRLLEAGAEWLVVWGAALAVLVCVAVYVIGKVRDRPAQHEPEAGRLLTNFREWHSQGVLDDAEYRTIKTTLAAQFRDELKDNGEKG